MTQHLSEWPVSKSAITYLYFNLLGPNKDYSNYLNKNVKMCLENVNQLYIYI